jgi:hypothetical protein
LVDVRVVPNLKMNDFLDDAYGICWFRVRCMYFKCYIYIYIYIDPYIAE